jgi:hypothetical protein
MGGTHFAVWTFAATVAFFRYYCPNVDSWVHDCRKISPVNKIIMSVALKLPAWILRVACKEHDTWCERPLSSI